MAKIFATGAHGAIDQRRRYTLEPYINHPASVVAIVRTATNDPDILAAAWLHDVVEDTAVDAADIRDMFGNQVADYVFYLTDPPKRPGQNRDDRNRATVERLRHAPKGAKTVKLADVIDNTKDIIRYDLGFAKVYIPEKKALLEVLTGGSKFLMHYAKTQIATYTKQLEDNK